MNDITFPIVEINENRLISVEGNTGHFYEMTPPDIEQYSDLERNKFFNSVSQALNNLDENSYFKFYKVGKRSFIETNAVEELHFPEVKILPSKEHLKLFFGGSDLFSEIGIFDDYIVFNGQYLKVLSAYEFSEDEIDESFLPLDVDYVLSIRKQSKEQSIKKLDHIRTKHLSSFLKNKKDISSEGAYEQAEDLMNDLTHGREALFNMELFFLVRGDTANEMGTNANNLISFMASKGLKLYMEGHNPFKGKTGLSRLFNELIPGVEPKLRLREFPNKTSHLRYLLPLRSSFLMGKGISFHDQNDDEIFLNPFSKEIKNRNMLVTGTTGAGKSVFVNKVVHHLIGKHPTVILDKGGSFKRLTRYHGGISLEDGINFMQFKDPIYLREVILSVVDEDKFDKLESGKLLAVIKKFLAETNRPTFKNLLEFLEQDFNGIKFYFEEIKDHLSDKLVENVPILYVDVENYPKNIVSPLIIFLLEYFKNIQVRQKILVFDECWKFLKGHASYIDECFRTFRKTGAFPIAISQGLNDFKGLGSDLYHSITNTSNFKVFFPQELEVSSEVSSFDIENIGNLQYEKGLYSDCYLKTSDNRYRKIIRNYLSPLELELFHTEPNTEDHLLKFLNKNGQYFQSSKDAIDAFIGLKYAQDTDSFNDAQSFIWN